MTNLKKRERAKTNASLISMVQRFSDITIMFAGLWLVCEVSGLSFLYMHLLVALITLVVFQMLGGITDFYRSWRGVRAATEFALLLQNWTLSVIFSAGLVAFNNDFDTQLKIWLAWYGLTSIGLVVCRSCIRIGAGWLRNHGYNKRMVAVAGDLAAGQMLMESFRNQPWLGFEVVGVYHDPKPGGVSNDWAGNLQQLVEDAKAGKIHNVYIAMQMCDGARVKKLVHQLADTTCSVLLIPDVFTFNILHSRIEEMNGVPVVPLYDTPLSGVNRLIKRAEDIVLATLILLLISPVLCCIALAVKLEGGCHHTAAMHSRNIENMNQMANAIDTSIFVKNGPCIAGLGLGGEGWTTMTITTPTGEGVTSARTFVRLRRCVLVDAFRIV
ncbi:undecaprenyl-phosphate glucose phosphotransferase [Escherichia coli]|uniref:undecaprenyl-phosphate glucose phosphotransferase n=1 Tax=Escherichia coli TaxID=562 RepID=UPI000C0423EE|nr:undecaprenyl-phosphate glucose phosphotransferase [Escherichia coli]PHL65766.1 undecaprenyl-phosphate glucose phosphotransferase [Escherichia coli]